MTAATVAALAVGGTTIALAWPSDEPGTTAAGTAVTGTAVGSPADSSATAGADPFAVREDLPPMRSVVDTVDLTTPPGTPAGRAVVLPRRDTRPFSMVGLTWSDPTAQLRGTAEVRTRSVDGGTWSNWIRLATADGSGADSPDEASAVGTTEAQWVGRSDAVELRVASASGDVSDRLPAGLRLGLVGPERSGGAGGGEPVEPDPVVTTTAPTTTAPTTTAPTTTAPAITTAPTTTAPATVQPTTVQPTTAQPTTVQPTTVRPSTVPPATVKPTTTAPAPSPTPRQVAVAKPAIVSRAGWRADESRVTHTPSYGSAMNAVIVHHTAGSNSYTCADSPEIVRGILAWDTDTSKGKKLADIGYNFLVDKCGTVFEGRKGGVDKLVVGAHAVGFNTNYVGVAVLGDYQKSGVPPVVRTVLANLSSWKLGMYGADPAGKVTVAAGSTNGRFTAGTRVTLDRIAGHLDVEATICPGPAFYGQLPDIRREASSWVVGLIAKGFTGGTAYNGTYHAKGTATLWWSVGTPSASLSRFELLIDGKVEAKAAGTARSAQLWFRPGRHTVAVRAVHVGGPTATSAAWTIVSDTTAPTFPRKPELSLRTGTVSTTSVPVTLSFKAADNTALTALAATAPAARSFPVNASTWVATVRPGRATSWSLKAADLVGNTATSTASRTPVLLAETAAKRSGSWSTKRNGSYLGGTALGSSAKNASLTWTFTGRSAALIVSRARATGKVDVYVDGKKAGTVDTTAGATAYRNAIWTKTWSGPGKHTIKIVVLGTSKRPSVTTDGIAYIR